MEPGNETADSTRPAEGGREAIGLESGGILWTHKIDGLTESDFVLAAKIDELPAGD
jgi:hypothetical protein